MAGILRCQSQLLAILCLDFFPKKPRLPVDIIFLVPVILVPSLSLSFLLLLLCFFSFSSLLYY